MAWRDTLREAKTSQRERGRGRELFLFSIASQISVLKLSSSALLKWWHDQSPPLPKKPLFPPMCPQLRVGSRLLRSTVFYCGTKSSGMNTGESLSTSSPTWKCKKEVSVLLFCLRRRFNYNLELSIPGVSAERA